jgi:hypothetical protein
MNPKESQWNVAQLSEYRTRKASAFGPIQSGLVKPKKTENYRPHADEAMALGNSWREEK